VKLITQYIKDVRRNRETRDWDAYVILNDKEEYLGSRQFHFDAETLCDRYVYEQLMRQPALREAA
jgi:hypothetical protein